MSLRRSIPPFLLLAAFLPVPATAQELPTGMRVLIVESLEGDREMALSMVDSMPATLLRFRPTPEVRDFAQQIDHAASSAAFLVSRFVLADTAPVFGDSTSYLNDKAELRQAVNAAYDYCLQQFRDLPDATLFEPTRIFGNEVPKWRVFMMAHSHGVWTLGQTVPYFRLNGMPPPAFGAF